MNIKNYLTLIVILFISCGVNKNSKQTNYKNSVKTISGKFTNTEYHALKTNIEKKLKTIIPKGKSILINYSQEASNCSYANLDNYTKSTITYNTIQNSKRMSSNYNTIAFFVYTENSFNKDIYAQKKTIQTRFRFFL